MSAKEEIYLMKKSNYEKMKEMMQVEFLKYEREKMIEKFHLEFDSEYLYLFFLGRNYRLSCKNGKVEWSEDGFQNCYDADYNEAMTIFDVLCCSKENCQLAGRFDKIDNLKGVVQTGYSSIRNDFFHTEKQYFDHKNTYLSRACERLGGIKADVGDVSYQIPVFKFLPIVFQFWDSDEEFPASLQIMWDVNVLDYMHYETTWFAVTHLVKRLHQLIAEMEEKQ